MKPIFSKAKRGADLGFKQSLRVIPLVRSARQISVKRFD